MSRCRLLPAPAQDAVLREHCAHARFVWNLAVEQNSHWRQGRAGAPGYLEQCRQLTAARAEHRWIVGRGRQWEVRRVSRNVGQVVVPKVGWVRGVTASAALSTGELMHLPGLTRQKRKRIPRLERKLARARRGSNRRRRVKHAIGRLRSRETDRRRDWVEKTSTRLARELDLIRVEDLKVKDMTRSAKGSADKPGRNVRAKAGLNREILRSGWGMLVRRLEDKAPGRVEKIQPAYTSQRCSACGHVDRRSRESQARFVCTTCGFACNADVNAAMNIAAGHAVTARRGNGAAPPVNREPQLLLQSA